MIKNLLRHLKIKKVEGKVLYRVMDNGCAIVESCSGVREIYKVRLRGRKGGKKRSNVQGDKKGEKNMNIADPFAFLILIT